MSGADEDELHVLDEVKIVLHGFSQFLYMRIVGKFWALTSPHPFLCLFISQTCRQYRVKDGSRSSTLVILAICRSI